jgi:hypothetical protein
VRRLLQLIVVGLLIAAAWQLLRELLGRSAQPATAHGGATTAPPRGASSGDSDRTGEADGPASMSKDELYRRAQELDIPGRSKMSKDELAAAIAATRGAPG